MDSCCTCTQILSEAPPYPSEKAPPPDRRVDCCGRVICGQCIKSNARFASYCPYCQVSSGPSALPQGLRDPPSYEASSSSAAAPADLPPSYDHSTSGNPPVTDEKSAAAAADAADAEDTLHFLDHDHDTITSLSLRYGVPASALRRANRLSADHLLQARRTILIPREYYPAGISLSPRPVAGEADELRKAKIRRFMTSTKVADYDVAALYLEGADYVLEAAIEVYFADEAWEKRNAAAAAAPQKKDKKRGFWRGL